MHRILSGSKVKLHKIITIIIFIVTAAVIAAVNSDIRNILSYSYAASSTTADSEIKKLEESLAKAAKDRQSAQKALNDAKSEQKSAIEQKKAIDYEIQALMSIIDISEDIIKQYDTKINEIEDTISATEELLKKRRDDFNQRLVIYYEEGEVSYIEMLLTSSGLMEFFSRLDSVRCMLEYDRLVISNYQTDKITLETKKSDLISLRDKAESLHESTLIRNDELNEKMKEAEMLISELEKDTEAAAKAYSEALDSEAKLNQQMQQKILSLTEKSNSSYVGGEYLWPLPLKYTYVSSGFGERIHPVTGKPQFHTSVDIPAPNGTEIYAANSGTVVEAAYHSADGNYILIDHGGGNATFYSHLSKFNVKVNQKVNKGDIIGYVGMTGWTTGYHLNFSIYENSKAVDPMKFFK